MALFLITGGAGFIGSNLAHDLLARGEKVRVLDDFSTGRRANLAAIADRIEIVEGSICDAETIAVAMRGVDYCLHQAAVPSVPRSIRAPRETHHANVTGSLNVFLAARDAGVKRVVYASSSSVYGRAQTFPLTESLPLGPISPYAVSKAAMELYAGTFPELFGLDTVGLRYFNVFGPRQDPHSAYAAVVPVFIRHLLRGEAPAVHGDGQQARDFTFVKNVIEANWRACQAPQPIGGVYNIACGQPVTVIGLAERIAAALGQPLTPRFEAARPGDIPRSWASIDRARNAFGYEPVVGLDEGLARTIEWFRREEICP